MHYIFRKQTISQYIDNRINPTFYIMYKPDNAKEVYRVGSTQCLETAKTVREHSTLSYLFYTRFSDNTHFICVRYYDKSLMRTASCVGCLESCLDDYLDSPSNVAIGLGVKKYNRYAINGLSHVPRKNIREQLRNMMKKYNITVIA